VCQTLVMKCRSDTVPLLITAQCRDISVTVCIHCAINYPIFTWSTQCRLLFQRCGKRHSAAGNCAGRPGSSADTIRWCSTSTQHLAIQTSHAHQLINIHNNIISIYLQLQITVTSSKDCNIKYSYMDPTESSYVWKLVQNVSTSHFNLASRAGVYLTPEYLTMGPMSYPVKFSCPVATVTCVRFSTRNFCPQEPWERWPKSSEWVSRFSTAHQHN